MNHILQKIQHNPEEWQKKVNQYQEILASAEALEKLDQGNPFDTKSLAEAFNLYQQCNYLIQDPKILYAAQRCQQKITWRHQFQSLFNEGKEALNQKFFKRALTKFLEAKKLFCTQGLEIAIQECQDYLRAEAEYEAILDQAYQLAFKGSFQEACSLLKPLTKQFDRIDGKNLLLQLQEILKGKTYFKAGLLAEKKGDLLLAKTNYQVAIQLIPELEKYLIRLVIVQIKLQEFNEALTILKKIKTQQSYYLQGYIYAQQQKWKELYQCWQYLPSAKIQTQQAIIQKLVIQDRLKKIQGIEDFVDLKQLELSQLASEDFIKKFGIDPLIKRNLDYHIIPYLKCQQWQEENLKLETLYQETEKQWRQEPNVTSLHNLMIAQYYLYQQDSTYLADLIPLWLSNIANLAHNPILHNISWLSNQEIDLRILADHLQQLLEEYLEQIKQDSIEEYLQLRDIYRREKWALILIQEMENQPISINNCILTPACYEKYYQKDPKITIPLNILGTLYTAWGFTVAACLEKDLPRSLTIKPHSITSNLEKIAQNFCNYHLGCFYLENYQWEQAVIPLNQVKNEIYKSLEWSENIEQLCQKQKQQLNYFNEHLEFSQFWYNLIQCQASLSYFSEYQAQKIILNLEQEKITYVQAVFELKKLQKLAPQNPVVKDILEKLEFERELQTINNLLTNKQFEEGIAQAKQSKYERVKMIVAELCIHILIEGFKSHELNFNDIYQLGKWAYELYPDDPAVQEIYHFSQELHEIQNLMLADHFDQAVDLAKNSSHELVRQYVAEFFIKTLLSGLESGDIPAPMIQQLGKWAYILCPDESAYQAIFDSLN